MRERTAPKWPPRRPAIVAVVATGAILSMPILSTSATQMYSGGLSYSGLTVCAFVGAGIGWLLMDGAVRTRRPQLLVALGVAVLVAATLLANRRLAHHFLVVGTLPDLVAIALSAGAAVRGLIPRSRAPASLVAVAAMASWVAYDLPVAHYLPLRDLHSYLAAGTLAAEGHSPYLQGVLTTPASPEQSPFVYPPFVLPLFQALSRLPVHVVEVAWLGVSIASVVAGLWLFGVRGRWIVLLVAWPALAIAISVGNVAVFAFLALAAGYRAAGALVLGGGFKFQSAIPALWAVRERRWREFAAGAGVLATLVVLSLAITGLGAWADWLRGLGFFQASVDQFTAMRGVSLAKWLSPVALIGVGAIAVVVALAGRDRNGLGRLGIASIIASPTLYIHGLAMLLPGALALRPTLMWFVLAVIPWGAWGLPIPGAWIAVAIVSLALLTSHSRQLEPPRDLPADEADLQPCARSGTVWPVPAPRATRGPTSAG